MCVRNRCSNLQSTRSSTWGRNVAAHKTSVPSKIVNTRFRFEEARFEWQRVKSGDCGRSMDEEGLDKAVGGITTAGCSHTCRSSKGTGWETTFDGEEGVGRSCFAM